MFRLLGVLLLLAVPALAQNTQQNQTEVSTDVAVIVNPSNPVDSVSFLELRNIFAGERQSWNGGLPVVVLVRAPQARERDVLLNQVLKMNEPEYKQLWIKKISSGEARREPLALDSNGMQLEAVRAEKGGIALIKMGDVRQGVKVLKLDGHLPGTEGYVLK
jgi:phosphate transport system substrate-binding protein